MLLGTETQSKHHSQPETQLSSSTWSWKIPEERVFTETSSSSRALALGSVPNVLSVGFISAHGVGLCSQERTTRNICQKVT